MKLAEVKERKTQMIKARVYSDDRNIEVAFDAQPWFEKASDAAITDLRGCDWGGDYPADNVAEWVAARDDHPDSLRIKRLFDYLSIIRDDPSKKDCSGFECHVDAEGAMSWLQNNRPHLLFTYIVDLPNPLEIGREYSAWVEMADFNTRQEAIDWINKNIGHSENGEIQLITEVQI